MPVCLGLLVFFLVTGIGQSGPDPHPSPLDPSWYTPKTPRGEILKEKTLVGNCFICHSFMLPDPAVVQPQFTHKIIKLEHGANDRCYNCHLINDRNMFTADNGSGIMHTTVEKLCARCHGLVYQDWKNGTHGLVRGKWLSASLFDRDVFTCTECHDPHSPAFTFKEIAPPPTWPDKFLRGALEEDHGEEVSSEYLKELKEMF